MSVDKLIASIVVLGAIYYLTPAFPKPPRLELPSRQVAKEVASSNSSVKAQGLVGPVFFPTKLDPAYNPALDPNGNPWPEVSDYLAGTPVLAANGLFTLEVTNATGSSRLVHLVDLEQTPNVVVRQLYIRGSDKFAIKRISPGRYWLRFLDTWTGEAFQIPSEVVASSRQGITQKIKLGANNDTTLGRINPALILGKHESRRPPLENRESVFLERIEKMYAWRLNNDIDALLRRTQSKHDETMRDALVDFVVSVSPYGEASVPILVRSSGDAELDTYVRRRIQSIKSIEGVSDLTKAIGQPYHREFRVRLRNGIFSVKTG